MSLGQAHSSLARSLAAEGRPRAALVAAVLIVRGSLRLDQAGLASLLGVPLRLVLDLEYGRCAPLLAPPALSRLVPELDWPALGLPVRAPPSHPAAARHPAAHQPARVTHRGRVTNKSPPP